ncbi:unnamed protein product [Mytilus edulis]|uniref:Uncharacterized protein n=1 Tax=Mytilus edulis TaxID=6550 RepID=A0A8S3QUQ8_MYTED|nr:unnamed protein product [Mytilus edulis]
MVDIQDYSISLEMVDNQSESDDIIIISDVEENIVNSMEHFIGTTKEQTIILTFKRTINTVNGCEYEVGYGAELGHLASNPFNDHLVTSPLSAMPKVTSEERSYQGFEFSKGVLTLGLKSSDFICQSVTNAVRFKAKNHDISLINYLDDFAGAEISEKAYISYKQLKWVLGNSSLEESVEKAGSPSHRMSFLGLFDRKAVTITDKLKDECKEANLPMKDTLIAYGSDGASVIVGYKRGVSALLKQVYTSKVCDRQHSTMCRFRVMEEIVSDQGDALRMKDITTSPNNQQGNGMAEV